MEVEDPSEAKQMRLRYAGTCTVCAAALPARTAAIYDRRTKTVRCLDCQPSAQELGDPGRRRRPRRRPTPHRSGRSGPPAGAAARVPHASRHRWRVRAPRVRAPQGTPRRPRSHGPPEDRRPDPRAVRGPAVHPRLESGRDRRGTPRRTARRPHLRRRRGPARPAHSRHSRQHRPHRGQPATVSGSSTPSATRDARPCAWKAGS